jgi:archaemetzincin
MAAEPDEAGAQHWREIALVPLDGPDLGRLEPVAAELSRHLGLPCRLARQSAGVELAGVPGRVQLDADRVLAALERATAPGVPLVAVTEHDLGLPLFTFVFGRARLGGAAAVVSLARLRPEFYGLPADQALVARRAAAEILHELGHVAGLAHCADRNCLMSFAASVEAADLRGLAFCPDCSARLPAGLAPRRLPIASAEL